jgi:hypothetical protein
VAVSVIDSLLAPYLGSGALRILKPYVPVSAAVADTFVRSVIVETLATG